MLIFKARPSRLLQRPETRLFSASHLVRSFVAERPEEIKNLTKAIGQDTPPLLSEGTGEDQRDFSEKWRNFKDPQRNRARREQLKEEFRKTASGPIYEFRHTGGKFFNSPKAAYSEKEAKYMPNIHGQSIGGIDTSLMSLLGRKPTLVRVFSNAVSEEQTDTFASQIDFQSANWNLIDVNVPTNWLSQTLVRVFSGRIQKSLRGDFHKYLVARKGMTPEARSLIWATNRLGGYIYVVDKNLRLRWAGSGEASETEKKLLRDLTRALK